jgi:tRNA (guanine37-N1)-methyltransferase
LITREFSIGDYVLSGGELPALVMTDAIVDCCPEFWVMPKVP